MLLKFAKKMKHRIDHVAFSSKVLGTGECDAPTNEFIINVSDISLKGCRYDPLKNSVEEHSEGVGDTKLGIVQLMPMEIQKPAVQPQPWTVRVPIYRSASATEQQLVCFIELNTKKKP